MCIFISALTPEDSDTEKEEEEGQKKEEEDKEGEKQESVPPPLPIQVGCTMYSWYTVYSTSKGGRLGPTSWEF